VNHTFSYDESLSSSPPVPTTAQSFLLSDPPLVTEKLLLSPSDLQICSTGMMSGIIATASPWVSVLRIPHLFLVSGPSCIGHVGNRDNGVLLLRHITPFSYLA
jgi:hypothetical protein